jgi:hypothetical protein
MTPMHMYLFSPCVCIGPFVLQKGNHPLVHWHYYVTCWSAFFFRHIIDRLQQQKSRGALYLASIQRKIRSSLSPTQPGQKEDPQEQRVTAMISR